jgi:hypothetical protein
VETVREPLGGAVVKDDRRRKLVDPLGVLIDRCLVDRCAQLRAAVDAKLVDRDLL